MPPRRSPGVVPNGAQGSRGRGRYEGVRRTPPLWRSAARLPHGNAVTGTPVTAFSPSRSHQRGPVPETDAAQQFRWRGPWVKGTRSAERPSHKSVRTRVSDGCLGALRRRNARECRSSDR